MNLTLSEDQILIRENAQKFLDLNYSFEKRQDIILKNKKLPFDYWKKYAELGWLGLAFSENVGGYDGNINNLMTLMECLGSSLILEPIIFNNIIIGKLFEELKIRNFNTSLEQIITGEKIYSFLFSPTESFENNILENLKIHKNNEKNILSGKCELVFGIDNFDYILIPLYLNNNINLYLLSNAKQGYEVRNFETVDNMIVSNIEFNNCELNNDELVFSTEKKAFFTKLDYIIDLAILSVCSQSLGIIDKMYELTLDYCKTRKQFGTPIGSFQVNQHKLVDMYIIKEEMRSLNYMAQLTFDSKVEERRRNVSLNKIFLGTHAKNMAQSCIQLHGGMGVAKEMSIGHYFSKITSYCNLFGNTSYHKERFASNDKF